MSMKSTASRLAALLVLAFVVLFLGSCVARMRITNATYQIDATGTIQNPGAAFRELYVAPAGTEQWSENLLPNNIIPGNTFSFPKKIFASAGATADLKLVSPSGAAYLVQGVELSKVGTIRVTEEQRVAGTGQAEAASSSASAATEENVQVQLGIDF